jgi:hypothetical protein
LTKEDYLIIEEFQNEIIGGSVSLGSPVHTMHGDVTDRMQLTELPEPAVNEKSGQFFRLV